MKDVSENGRAPPSYKSAGIERRTCFPIQAGARLENSCDAPRYFAFVNGSVMNLEDAPLFSSLARVKKYIIFSLDPAINRFHCFALEKRMFGIIARKWIMNGFRKTEKERERDFLKISFPSTNYLTERIDSLK